MHNAVSQRRLFLLQGLALSLTLCTGGCTLPPIRQGIHRMDGELRVDGRPVGPEAIIRPGHTVTTGPKGQTVMVMGEEAFLLGENTTVTFHADMPPTPVSSRPSTHLTPVAFHLGADPAAPGVGVTTSRPVRMMGFTLKSGRILSVFGAGPKILKIPTATIGIRGTGIFLQVEPQQDYVCLCYGQAVIRMDANPRVNEALETQHHTGRFLSTPTQIRKAPMAGHTDAELFMLEALVNRRPPFRERSYRD